MLDERREFERFDTSHDAAIKSTKYVGEWFAAEIKNVSKSGLCFETMDIQPDLKDNMELEVKLPGGGAFVTVSGSIAWNKYLDNRCLVGIELADMDEDTKKLYYSLCV
jgi:hypothetical protein